MQRKYVSLKERAQDHSGSIKLKVTSLPNDDDDDDGDNDVYNNDDSGDDDDNDINNDNDDDDDNNNNYHLMQMFLPFHWPRAHHVTCK